MSTVRWGRSEFSLEAITATGALTGSAGTLAGTGTVTNPELGAPVNVHFAARPPLAEAKRQRAARQARIGR